MANSSVYLSVVIPLLNEEGNVIPLHQKLTAAMREVGRSYELIYVDDGSTDQTVPALKAIHDDCVTVITLRRNFGQTAALAAGIDIARGEVLVTLDADLQNDPADIPRMVKLLDDGYDLVTGWRRNRKDPFLTRILPSQLANIVISRFTKTPIHDFGCTLRAYRTSLLREVHLYGELHRLLPALLSHLGCRIQEVEVAHHPRTWGTSKYGLARTLKVLLDLMTIWFMGNYGTKPVYLFGTVALVCFLGGTISGSVMVYQKLVNGVFMITTPLLHLTTFLMLLGIQFLMIGLLADMLMRTYYESQNKKIYHVRDIKLPASVQLTP